MERTGDTGTSTSDQEVASSKDVKTSEPSSVLFLGNAGDDDDGDKLAIEMAVRTKLNTDRRPGIGWLGLAREYRWRHRPSCQCLPGFNKFNMLAARS